MRYKHLYSVLFAAMMTALLVTPLAMKNAAASSHVLPRVVPMSNGSGFEFEIVSVVTRNESGYPQREFKRGQFVFVEVTVRRKGGGYYYYYYYSSKSFLTLVRATMGSPPTLYGLGGFRGSLKSGEEITAEIAFRIPRNAPTGTMNITVFVWSNWAYLGGVPLTSPAEVTITVKP